MFSWPIRIVGWCLAALSLLKLWLAAGLIQYQKVFADWLLWLEELVVDIPLDELERWVAQPALEWVRSFGVHIPPLQDHWEQVFVLMWLLITAVVRNVVGDELRAGAALTLSGVYSLFAAVLIGTVPPDSPIVLLGPLAAIAALGSVGWLSFGRSGSRWFQALRSRFLRFAAVSMIAAILIMLAATPLLALVAALLLIAIIALFLTRDTPSARMEGIRKREAAAPTMIGVDIIAAMGLAAGVATLAADPPILTLL